MLPKRNAAKRSKTDYISKGSDVGHGTVWQGSCRRSYRHGARKRYECGRRTAQTAQFANCASRAAGGDRRGRTRAPVRGAHVEPDYQLPWVPLPIEALRAEKYVGDVGDSPRGGGISAAASAWTSGMDSAAANSAATVSSGTGVGAPRKCVGHRISAGGLGQFCFDSGRKGPCGKG